MSVVNLDIISEMQIRAQGKIYTPALLPKDIDRGPIGICFDWCALQASKNPKYDYVEGLATDPGNPDRWILHAWLTDGINAYDPTWAAFDDKGKEFLLPVQYIGIKMNLARVVAFMRITGYQGVFANRFRAPDIVEDIIARATER